MCANKSRSGCEPAAASRVEASLELDFEFDRAAGHTVLAASRQQAPLQVVRAFALEDGSALAHLHNVSGGLLGGDRLELRAHVGAGAKRAVDHHRRHAHLSRTRAERLMPCSRTKSVWTENALLEYVPDPIIPFAGARFRQQTTIKLAPGAGLFWWEILAPGREARGELFAYDRMELKMDIWTPNRLIAAERVRLEPRTHALSSLARLGDYRYWATFYICRVGAGPKLWSTAEERLREVAASVSAPGETRWGISTLVADGLVVRCLAREGRWVLAGLREIWAAAKSLLYGREAIPPRKVN